MSEPVASAPAPQATRELVITLFELGREITAVLDLPELLLKIPQLIARLTGPTQAQAQRRGDRRRELGGVSDRRQVGERQGGPGNDDHRYRDEGEATEVDDKLAEQSPTPVRNACATRSSTRLQLIPIAASLSLTLRWLLLEGRAASFF